MELVIEEVSTGSKVDGLSRDLPGTKTGKVEQSFYGLNRATSIEEENREVETVYYGRK